MFESCGLNLIWTSAISFLASFNACTTFFSSSDDCSTVTAPGTLTVRSTNICAPALRARRLSMDKSSGMLSGDEDVTRRGYNDFSKDSLIGNGTLASVKSCHASKRRLMPCRKMTDDTSRPPIGSNGNFGNAHVPMMATKATTLEYASLR